MRVKIWIVTVLIFAAHLVFGQQVNTLFSFDLPPRNPRAALIQGTDGNFYGTSEFGGANVDSYSDGYGTVFKVTPAGEMTILVSFNGDNGAFPKSPLVQGSDGNFYGTTYNGGDSDNGTVFKLTPDGVLTTLISFNSANGANPRDGLVEVRMEIFTEQLTVAARTHSAPPSK